MQFGPGGSTVAATFTDQAQLACTGTVFPSTPWGSMVQLTISAQASFRIPRPDRHDHDGDGRPSRPHSWCGCFRRCTDHQPGAIPLAHRRRAVPLRFAFEGSATSPQAPIRIVQYKVEGGEFANADNVSGNWSQFRIILPLPPTTPGHDHTLTIRAVDTFGTTGEVSIPVVVQPDPPIVVPPGSKTTFSGAPTTSRSPAGRDSNRSRPMRTSARARVRASSIRCGC